MAAFPSRQELDSIIAAALAEYDDAVRAEWAQIRIEPEKWRCSPWGDESGGFWAVAVHDGRVLWFNDIEEGFNWSRYSSTGTIDEYLCDQNEFTDILERLAQTISQVARATFRESDVPPQISGRGTIVRRQTTYWEVRAANDSVYRIHFRDKLEAVFASADYASIEPAIRHPLLVQYDEPTRSLYFTGRPLRPTEVAERLERVIRGMSNTWRGLADYAGSIDMVGRQLRAGHGMLMNAPESVCAGVAAALEGEGVRTSIPGSAPARSGKQALVLGRSYVIANAFAFENRDDPDAASRSVRK